MKRKYLLVMVIFNVVLLFCLSCATVTNAYDDLNSGNEMSIQLSNLNNTIEVVKYIQEILSDIDHYEIKAFNRNPFSVDNKKNIFMFHCYYGVFKDGIFQHTISFSDTPDESIFGSCWIIDKHGDFESMELYLQGSKIWDVEEYTKEGYILDLEETAKKILKKIGKSNDFWGAASVRDYPWYLQIIIWTLPIPIIPATTVFIGSIGTDNCVSAVLETMVWRRA